MELLKAFPRLRCISLDTTHLVMKMKSANGHNVTAGSRFLSSIMTKFNRPLSSRGSCGALPFWTWGSVPTAQEEEARLLGHVQAGNLPQHLLAEAEDILESEGPWKC